MNLSSWLNTALGACGLVGLLMVIMAGLAFLRKRGKISEKAGIFIIMLVLLLVLIALSVGEN